MLHVVFVPAAASWVAHRDVLWRQGLICTRHAVKAPEAAFWLPGTIIKKGCSELGCEEHSHALVPSLYFDCVRVP